MQNYLVLDVGGVLRHNYNYKGFISDLELSCSPKELKDKLWKDFFGGYYDLCQNEHVCLYKLSEIIGKNVPHKQLYEAYINNRGKYDSQILDFIKEQQSKGVKIIVLTDCNQLHVHNNMLDAHDLGIYKWFNSCTEGICKSDTLCYKLVQEQFNCKPDNIYFVDDNESNLDKANENGWNTFLWNHLWNYDKRTTVLKIINKTLNQK